MKHFDEYQRLMRYKYGYYTLLLIVFLQVSNYFITAVYSFQWAETQRLESMIIILLATVFYTVMSVYSGAYFAKKQHPLFPAVVSLLTGALFFRSSLFFPIIEDGQVTMQMINFIVGINFISIPVTYLVKVSTEKRKETKAEKEA